MGIKFTNIWENAAISQRCVLVHGQADSAARGVGSVIVWFKNFPSQRFPMVDGFFKAMVVLEEGENSVTFETEDPQSHKETATLSLRYLPIKGNVPVHFVLLLGKDSPGRFQSPDYKIQKEGNDIDTAVKKLRMGSYMMSSFTQEQMNRNSFGLRSFTPYSEYEQDTLSSRDQLREHVTTHVHVVRCSKTVAEINDPDLAQQNSNAQRSGDLFGLAHDALREYGGPFADNGQMVQAAVIFMDTQWDKQMNLVRGHAALGGGIGNFKLAIFGGHTLWSWPTCLEDLPAACLDETRTDTNVVANDAGQSGSAWEAMNIGIGAFQHEVGHLLGCPHEPDGVMLRGYLFWNRSFSALEGYNSRENRRCLDGRPAYANDEDFWNRMDIMRFLYHPSFRLPGEGQWPEVLKPIIYPTNDGINIQCTPGIYMVDIHVDGESRTHIEYNLSPNVTLSLEEIENRLPPDFRGKKIDLHIHSPPMEQMDCNDVVNFVRSGQHGEYRESTVAGSQNGDERTVTLPDNKNPVQVRIWSGLALDGIELIYGDGSNVVFGNQGGSPKDVRIAPGDNFAGIALRCGLWVDAGGVITQHARSEIWGGGGGGRTDLVAPQGSRIRGFKGWFGDWMNGMCILY